MDWIVNCAILLTVGIATITDLRHRIIPNWLVYGSVFLALIAHLLDAGISGLLLALFAAVITLPFNLLGFFIDQVGGGDVKLYAALAAWTATWRGAVAILLAGWILNAIIAVITLFVTPKGREKLKALLKHQPYTYGLPQAPGIALAILLLMVTGHLT